MKGYTITDIGKVRSENQDCVRFIQNAVPSFGVLALCDGMGGARAGSIASEIALTTFISNITEYLTDKKNKTETSDKVRQAAEQANRLIFERGKADTQCEGMGTTLVAAIIMGKDCYVVNVGDSRAYLVSDDKIEQITRDHSFVEEMVGRGTLTREAARNHPRKNIITRALGAEEAVLCDIFEPKLAKNDLLLLCSDGLSNTLTDEEIFEISSNSKDLSNIGKELLDLALSRGAPDNVTVGLLRK